MNKIIVVIVALIVILGGFMLLGNKNTNPTQKTQPTSTQSTTKPGVKEVNNPTTNAASIVLTNAEFMPKDVTIKAGSTVMWINKSGATANIKSDNHPTHLLYPVLNLGEFASGTTLQATFEKAGKYSYHNDLNLSETGTITVE